MVAPANEYMEKVEEAFKALLISLRGTALRYTPAGGVARNIPIYAAWDDDLDKEDELRLPYIGVICERAVEHVAPGTGNFAGDAEIELRSAMKDTTRVEHKRRSGIIAAILWRTALPDEISALGIANFTAQLWTRGPSTRFEDEEQGAMVCQWTGVLKGFCA